MKATLWIASLVIVASVSFFLSGIQRGESHIKDKIFNDIMEINKLSATKEDDYKRTFINNCLLARQVYQWSWYRSEKTTVGYINAEKRYAMSLKEYNDLVELSWKLNRQLNIPFDSWENYIPISKWILESSINPYAEHNTGEVIRMTGYTVEGMVIALYHYKHTLCIQRGHPFYIPELYENPLSEQRMKEVFRNVENVVKFDYAYIQYLLSEYDYRWDWVLTGFHFGEAKTLFWKSSGLKMIPNYRLDGQWGKYFLREYYQNVFELAQGISLGRMDRISRFEEIVGIFKRSGNAITEYINVVRLRLKAEEKALDMDEKCKQVQSQYSQYRAINEDLLSHISILNEAVFACRADDAIKENNKLRQWRRKVVDLFNKLTGMKR